MYIVQLNWQMIRLLKHQLIRSGVEVSLVDSSVYPENIIKL